MPASSFVNLYYNMHDARNNFDAMRPAPVCLDANQAGQCQPIHISTDCYYGYHEPKTSVQVENDCEMLEAPPANKASPPLQLNNPRKRSASDDHYPQTKRIREEVQREKNIAPETNETVKPEIGSEDLLETLFWNTHGGNLFHLLQCL